MYSSKKLVLLLSLLSIFISLSNGQQNQSISGNHSSHTVVNNVTDTETASTVSAERKNKNYIINYDSAQNKSEGKLPGSVFVNNNYPKPISLWDSKASKTSKDTIIDTKAAINIPGFPTGDGEYDFNPDDLEALQDKLVDETLQGVSSLINNDSSDLNDDFDSFVFPESSTEPNPSKMETEIDLDHIYRVPIKPKKYKKHENQNSTSYSSVPSKYVYKHFSNFHLFINLYDHHLWDSEKIRANVTEQCGKDMKNYLSKLRNGMPVALKASDSSGRYGGMYFFGNDFWMGSSQFCDEVNFESHQLGSLDRLPEMGFYMTKILVRMDPYFTEAKLLQLGQCLPISCEIDDIYTILRYDPASSVLSHTAYKTGLNIFHVRRVPGGYQLQNDPKYFMLVMIVAILVVITFVASIYESVLLGKGYDLVERRRSSRVNKRDIDQIKKNGATGTGSKHMEMYRIGQENNNVEVNAVKNRKHLSNGNQIERSTRTLNIFSRFLICFGLRGNLQSICNVDKSDPDSLTCVHGMRLFSLLWTIMVHTYLQLFAVGENRHSRKLAERTFIYQIVGNATFSVDTFFFISGVLIVYLYYKSTYSIDGVKQVRAHKLPNAVNESIFAILYRYIRLTPAYFFVIVTNELALKWTYDHSVFQPGIIDHITCNKYWYRNILYANNWYPFSEMCMIWSWYMANDMQFYVIAIILLILSKRFFKISAITVILLLLASWVVAMFVSIHFKYIHKVADPFESFDILYDKPWQRMGPYIVGMITGYIIVRKRTAPKVSLLLNVSLWCLSFGILFALIFGVWKGQLSLLATAFYVGMGHTAWGVALVWICLSCYWGLARPINSFLSYRAFYPLSRLTYCAYLIHPVIMVVTSFQQPGPISMTHSLILTTFLGNAVLSFIVALIISLLFEAPVIRVLKIIFRK